jgi:hypothetical protein
MVPLVHAPLLELLADVLLLLDEPLALEDLLVDPLLDDPAPPAPPAPPSRASSTYLPKS